VLGLVITDHLYASFPDLPEGDLARVRAAVVSTQALAPAAERLGIAEALLLGKGEENSGGRHKHSILADCVEAVIGAVYLTAGIEGARVLVLELLGPLVTDIAEDARLGDPKNRLQELAAQMVLGLPCYVVRERGPDHAKHFTADAIIAGEHLGSGDGRSKKEAERRAAEVALTALLERWYARVPGMPAAPAPTSLVPAAPAPTAPVAAAPTAPAAPAPAPPAPVAAAPAGSDSILTDGA
jgi:ribonuclease III